MTNLKAWRRVSRGNQCPICGKPDWCLVSSDGAVALCQRVESTKRIGEAGWLHRLRDDDHRPTRRIVHSVCIRLPPSTSIDLAEMTATCQAALRPEQLDYLAASLGLSVNSLHQLDIGWSSQQGAWTFPMKDPAGRILGIRLRYPNGCKKAVRGSQEGLFIPSGRPLDKNVLFICEGPTDAAALIDLRFSGVIGRPSCTGGIRLLVELVRRRQPEKVVIVADADEPGRRGADNLAAVLVAYVHAVSLIMPPEPIKDARAWLQAGGNHDDVQRAIEAASVRRLAVRAVMHKKG